MILAVGYSREACLSSWKLFDLFLTASELSWIIKGWQLEQHEKIIIKLQVENQKELIILLSSLKVNAYFKDFKYFPTIQNFLAKKCHYPEQENKRFF